MKECFICTGLSRVVLKVLGSQLVKTPPADKDHDQVEPPKQKRPRITSCGVYRWQFTKLHVIPLTFIMLWVWSLRGFLRFRVNCLAPFAGLVASIAHWKTNCKLCVCARARSSVCVCVCVLVCVSSQSVSQSVSVLLACLPACQRGSRELCWELHGAQFFKMSSLEQRLSRIEEKLKQENEEARRRIDLNIDMSPRRSRPRPSECPLGGTGLSVTARIAEGKIGEAEGGREGAGVLRCS